ncbi:gp125 [Sphingomonas phage PAU]|uniref:gp125 n=1 Tax=Sphingomonas phage PAU TaxID=1150991 RepID=UPI0002573270|nr:gp125 [Sphingomonas phage PAU]AFF28123.1 gp125 [Sphingomonas phage PAU]
MYFSESVKALREAKKYCQNRIEEIDKEMKSCPKGNVIYRELDETSVSGNHLLSFVSKTWKGSHFSETKSVSESFAFTDDEELFDVLSIVNEIGNEPKYLPIAKMEALSMIKDLVQKDLDSLDDLLFTALG